MFGVNGWGGLGKGRKEGRERRKRGEIGGMEWGWKGREEVRNKGMEGEGGSRAGVDGSMNRLCIGKVRWLYLSYWRPLLMLINRAPVLVL